MDHLHPEVRKLIQIRGWSLSSIQESSMEDLVSGYDRVLVSPTGSGKTEAAILPLASRFITEEWEGLSILYITPLRASKQRYRQKARRNARTTWNFCRPEAWRYITARKSKAVEESS